MALKAKSFLPPSFRAKYEQTIKKKVSGKLKKSRGKIEYLYPKNILFEQSEPEKIIWVSNQKTTWFYQAPFIPTEPGHLKITPTGSESPSKIFDILKNGLRSNKVYSVRKSKQQVELIFNSKETKLKFQKAILNFKGPPLFKNLHSIQMVEKNGDPLTFVFKSIRIDIAFKPQHFVFKPPPNTRTEGP